MNEADELLAKNGYVCFILLFGPNNNYELAGLIVLIIASLGSTFTSFWESPPYGSSCTQFCVQS